MQGQTVVAAAMDNSPPLPAAATLPASPGMRSHQQRPSTASIAAAAAAMPDHHHHHAKRPSSRITDGLTSRSSDDDNKTAVKVGMSHMPFSPPVHRQNCGAPLFLILLLTHHLQRSVFDLPSIRPTPATTSSLSDSATAPARFPRRQACRCNHHRARSYSSSTASSPKLPHRRVFGSISATV